MLARMNSVSVTGTAPRVPERDSGSQPCMDPMDRTIRITEIMVDQTRARHRVAASSAAFFS